MMKFWSSSTMGNSWLDGTLFRLLTNLQLFLWTSGWSDVYLFSLVGLHIHSHWWRFAAFLKIISTYWLTFSHSAQDNLLIFEELTESQNIMEIHHCGRVWWVISVLVSAVTTQMWSFKPGCLTSGVFSISGWSAPKVLCVSSTCVGFW